MTVDLSGYDSEQVRLMEEMCILIDANDKVVGADTKKNCHLMSNIKNGLLHRAFSVFIFDNEGRLLLQQRADEKITFPGCWTNTCCSHPLNKQDELEEIKYKGVKVAAQRKLQQELGIPVEQVPLDKFKFLTRIHYLAPSDNEWGEHERNVSLNLNPNEVQSVKYVTPDELKLMFDNSEKQGTKITPWFKLIAENFLFGWWEELDCIENKDEDTRIHRL